MTVFDISDQEQEDLNKSIKLIRKLIIRSAMEQMTWWGRMKFRAYLLWLRIRRVFA